MHKLNSLLTYLFLLLQNTSDTIREKNSQQIEIEDWNSRRERDKDRCMTGG